MEKAPKFLLPSPNFDGTKKTAPKHRPHFLTPSGMTLLPREKQPPPMYGPRGTTMPAKFLPTDRTKQKRNETQFCEPCEMELQSMEDFRLHRAQHKPCQIDGCNYRGHPSVMDKHIDALHTTGLFDKFKKLSTPEEIATWREERRKRYPTVANVEMRQKAQEQRQKRGERLEANKSRFGKREDRARMKRGERAERKKEQEAQKGPEDHSKNMKNVQRNNRRKKAKRCAQASETTTKPELKVVKAADKEVSKTECHNFEMFKGTKTMSDYKHFKVKNVVESKNALTCLIGMYGSDDESNSSNDEETENCDEKLADIVDKESTIPTEKTNDSSELLVEETENDKTHTNTPPEDIFTSCSTTDLIAVETPPTETAACIHQNHVRNESNEPLKVNELISNERTVESVKKNESSDEAPEEVAIGKTSQLPDRAPPIEPPRKRAKPATEAPKKLQRSIQSGLDYRKSRLRKQNTMLEKLLEPDIRHERNVLLQCVRFVCENSYFGIGQRLDKDVTLL